MGWSSPRLNGRGDARVQADDPETGEATRKLFAGFSAIDLRRDGLHHWHSRERKRNTASVGLDR
jgi:hypothetical protein